MESSARTIEYAKYLLQLARQVPFKLIEQPTASPKFKSIHQKLVDLYVEECLQKTGEENMELKADLLQLLVKRERLSTVVVNLYPGSEGYSIMLRGKAGTNDTETIKLPYEESEILDYIDNAELPPIFIELLEKAQVNVFYSGCVIIELRDYRRSTLGTYDAQFVLLKPTSQTLLSDINSIMNDGHLWTQDDQFQLESQLLLATQEPLCLDPSPTITYVNNELEYERTKFNNPLLKRNAKKYNQVAINRKRKFSQSTAPRELSLYEFLQQKRERDQPNVGMTTKSTKMALDIVRQRAIHLTPPSIVDVDKYATVLDKGKLTADNSLVFVEEYVLERERSQLKPHQAKSIYTKVSVYQRPSDEYYFGELYIDHDYVDGLCKGNSCQFPFGSKANMKKYIEQLIEIFTEGGRLFARVTHTEAGKTPEIMYAHSNSLISPSSVTLTSADNLLFAQGAGHYVPSVSPNIDATNSRPNLAPLELPMNSAPNPNAVLISPQTPTPSTTQHTLAFGLLQSPENQSQNGLQKHAASLPLGPTRQHRSKLISQLSHESNTSPAVTPTSSGAPCFPSTYPTPHNKHLPTQTKQSPHPTPSPKPLIGLPAQGSLPLNISSVTMVSSTAQRQRPDDGLSYTLMSPPGVTITTVASGNAPPNINITNIAGLSPNINIQNLAQLQGMNITGIPGLHSVQVSLSGLPVASGHIAVPISMVNASQSMLSNQGTILVSSLPGGVVSSLSGGFVNPLLGGLASANIETSQSALNPLQNKPDVTASSHSYIAMVTTISTVPYSPMPSTSVSSTATPPSTIFSMPIAISSDLPQLKPATMTASVAPNVHGHTLFQLPGQHGLQLLSVQHKTQLPPLSTKPPPLISTHTSLPVTTGSALSVIGQPSTTNLANLVTNLQGQPQLQQPIESSCIADNASSGIRQPLLTGQQTMSVTANISQQQMSQNVATLNQSASALNVTGLTPNISGLPQNVSGINQAISSINQNVPRLPQNVNALNNNIAASISSNISGLSQNPVPPAQLTMGIKAGTTGLTHQQLVQLANVNPQNLTLQQIHTQMAIQRQLQLRQSNQALAGLTVQQQQASVASTSKYKKSKRTTPTPPKAP